MNKEDIFIKLSNIKSQTINEIDSLEEKLWDLKYELEEIDSSLEILLDINSSEEEIEEIFLKYT